MTWSTAQARKRLPIVASANCNSTCSGVSMTRVSSVISLLCFLLWRALLCFLRRLLWRALLCLFLWRALLRRFLRRAGHGFCDSAVQSAAHLRAVTNQTPDEPPVRAENQGVGDASGRHATEELVNRMRGEYVLIIHSKSFHETLDRLLVFRRVLEVHSDDYQPVLAIPSV